MDIRKDLVTPSATPIVLSTLRQDDRWHGSPDIGPETGKSASNRLRGVMLCRAPLPSLSTVDVFPGLVG